MASDTRTREHGHAVMNANHEGYRRGVAAAAKAAEGAADEWWKSLKAKDAGDKNAVDFGSLPDHMINKIRALTNLPADQPSK